MTAAFLIVAGILNHKVINKNKALKYLSFSMGWTFLVFGVSMMFTDGEAKPPDALFYTAILPIFIASFWFVKSIK